MSKSPPTAGPNVGATSNLSAGSNVGGKKKSSFGVSLKRTRAPQARLKARPKKSAGVNAAVEQRTIWRSMPGWGTAADLIPPELINARHLKVLRKLMVAGLVVLLLVCAGGYYLASRENSAAADDLIAMQDRTIDLQWEGHSYSGVVSIQGSIGLVQTQIAQAMNGDVDLVALMGQLQSNLPKTMTITQESILISTAGVVGAATGASGGGLDTSGLPRIGTITLSGTGKTLDDLSDYIDRLRAVPGLVDLVPVSNITSSDGKAGTQYNLRIALTNALLSHRFDVVGTGTK